MGIRPNLGGYLESWSHELRTRQDRIRLLIGDAHWLTDGQHKEAIVRDFLARYLPSHLLVSRGFVRPPDANDRCSPEVDILIADSMRQPPLLNEGGVIVVPPSSVLAHLEIKTTFSRETLRKSLSSIRLTQESIGKTASPEAVWRCVCFFGCQDSLTPTAAATQIAEEIKLASSSELATLPTCIVVVGRFVAFLRGQAANSDCSIKLFEANDLSLPCAAVDMFSTITHQLVGPNVGELDQIIESFPMSSPTIVTVTLEVTDVTG